MQYRRRLRSRIIISFALMGFVLTALFAAATLWLRSVTENDLVDGWLQSEAANFVEFKRQHPSPDAQFSFSRQIEVWVWRPQSPNIPLEWRQFDTGVHDIRERDPASGQTRQYKLAVHRASDIVSYLRYDFSQEMLSAQQLQFALFAAVAAFSLLALLLGAWFSSRVMRPVSDLATRLRSFSGGSAQPERLAPHFANDEVGQLAAALDDYSDRLTELVRRDREFNADVSHELRTPLAVIRGAVELLLAQPQLDDKTLGRLRRVERAAQQCTDLTSALLLLSRGERQHGATDLCRVVEQIVDANRMTLANKPIELSVDGERDVLIDAPEPVVAVALSNLIGNACKYTAEGEIRVTVLTDRVEIRDSGPGIGAEEAGRLFERGYRGKSSEGSRGAGIGLAIVGRLCELYGWDASLAPRPEGGAIAILRFNPPRRSASL